MIFEKKLVKNRANTPLITEGGKKWRKIKVLLFVFLDILKIKVERNAVPLLITPIERCFIVNEIEQPPVPHYKTIKLTMDRNKNVFAKTNT